MLIWYKRKFRYTPLLIEICVIKILKSIFFKEFSAEKKISSYLVRIRNSTSSTAHSQFFLENLKS